MRARLAHALDSLDMLCGCRKAKDEFSETIECITSYKQVLFILIIFRFKQRAFKLYYTIHMSQKKQIPSQAGLL